MLKRLFKDMFTTYQEKDYFQEAFGYRCVDDGDVAGTLGADLEAQLFRNIRKPDLWPIKEKCSSYSEDDLFDVIEFLFDYISKPIDGYHHSYGNCGWHYSSFNSDEGRKEWRERINHILEDYQDGYELSLNGEILSLPEKGLNNLLGANLPSIDDENVEKRVERAILKFRRYRSSFDERRDAIRDLADVLEYLQPQLKIVLTKKDESDLFNIANNFGIRHHNDKQKTDYDKAIWYSWMFYYYLATIHAASRLIDKNIT